MKNNDPIFKAREDHKEGLGQDYNPYPKDTIERLKYGLEMHRLWLEEFNASEAAGKLGV